MQVYLFFMTLWLNIILGITMYKIDMLIWIELQKFYLSVEDPGHFFSLCFLQLKYTCIRQVYYWHFHILGYLKKNFNKTMSANDLGHCKWAVFKGQTLLWGEVVYWCFKYCHCNVLFSCFCWYPKMHLLWIRKKHIIVMFQHDLGTVLG